MSLYNILLYQYHQDKNQMLIINIIIMWSYNDTYNDFIMCNLFVFICHIMDLLYVSLYPHSLTSQILVNKL